MKIIKADKLVGELSPPPSKSVLHRYIIASSLAKGISKIENISFSEDIIATIEAMKKLGAKIEQKDNYLLIDGSDTFKNLNENIEIDCNESGSTLRFLFPLSIDKEKDIKSKIENFEKFKIKHSYIDENVILLEGQLKAGIYEIDGNISSQFITGLLFSLPLLEGESKIIINGKLESSNYIDISLDFRKYIDKVVDIRVPNNMTVKELLKIIVESYGLPLEIKNPSIRVENFNVILTGFSFLYSSQYVRNGSLLVVEKL